MGQQVLAHVGEWIMDGDLRRAGIGVANVQVLLNKMLEEPSVDVKIEVVKEEENYLLALSKVGDVSREQMDRIGATARIAKQFFEDAVGAFREGNLPLVGACLINAQFLVNTLISPPPEVWLNVNRP